MDLFDPLFTKFVLSYYYFRITKSEQYEYAYLVRSYREDNNTKHEYSFNLRRLDQIKNNPSFQNLAIASLRTIPSKRYG